MGSGAGGAAGRNVRLVLGLGRLGNRRGGSVLARKGLPGIVGGAAGLQGWRGRDGVRVWGYRRRRSRGRRRSVVRGDAVLVLVLLLLLLVLRQARAVCRVLLRLGRLLVGPSQG